MATTDDDIKIDLDEKVEKTPDIEVIKADESPPVPEKTNLPTDDGIEKLKKQLDDEKTARIAAEQRAQTSEEGEARARGEAHDNNLHLVTNAIASVKQSQKMLRGEYATAMQNQDFERVAELNEQMSDNSAKLLQLENGKAQLEKTPKPAPRAADPVNDFAKQLSPRSAAWVRAHPEFVRDERKYKLMLAAHELAMDQHAPDTDEYFTAIERTLRIGSPAPEANGHDKSIQVDIDPMKDAAKAKPRAAPASAPVTRSGNGTGNRPNQVTLTAAEVEMAEMTGVTPEEYARNKQALKKEGRLN